MAWGIFRNVIYIVFNIDVCCRTCQEQGHRAYFKEKLEVTKCQQDVLHGNDKGLLLKYVATYAPKFSDSFAREWLNDEASAFSVARRVLFDYQPAEPEMWLYLFCSAISTLPVWRHHVSTLGAVAWHGSQAPLGDSL